MLIEEYFTLQKQHEQQYGERTVVLMQIGSFYEMYGYDPSYCTTEEAKIDKQGKMWTEPMGHAVDMSVVLNCVLTHENNNESYGINNPHKVGFPCIAYEKNRATLLANDYVIVRVDQEKNGGKVNRFVAEICNPTMFMDNITPTRPTSNIACVYIEYQQGLARTNNKYDNFLITTGVAVVDVITGQNRVCEFYSKAEDQVHAVQELYRFLISHYPRELIFHVGDMPEGLNKHTDQAPNPYIKYLERVLELRRFERLTAHVNAVPADYKKISYQIEVFNKLFTKKPEIQQQATQGIRLNIVQKKNEKIIEDLGLERMNYGRIAYMLLMQHCHSHNADIIMKLAKPDLQWIDERKHLILTHNAIVQLDLIPEGGKPSRLQRRPEIDSLLAVLDQNQTHLGRRLLQSVLQNPMLDPDDIQAYYNMVEEMLISTQNAGGNDPMWMDLDRKLKELPDIGRLQRKLEIKLITPKEFSVLYRAYLKIINIYISILSAKAPTLQKHLLVPNDANSFNQFIAKYAGIFNFEALECCHIDTNESGGKWLEFNDCPIKLDVYPDIDEQVRQLCSAETILQQIIDHLNGFLVRTTGKKISFKAAKRKQGATKQDPTGTIITTTDAKAKVLLGSPIDTTLCGVLQVLPYTSAEKMLTSDRIGALCTQIDTTRTWLRYRLMAIYEALLEEMVTKFTFYVPVANLVAKLDLVHSYAKVSNKYNYHRPELVIDDNTTDTSFLESRELRHPIIEQIIDGAYVTNDIMLGAGQPPIENTLTRTNGKLLYGVNRTGKSSLAKAVALNIIMAQAGCFVPSRLRFKPYSKVITRLSGVDNILKGQSSFEVEMTELRTILRQADSKTLVIGDELAKGTESDSATGITVSAILYLLERKSSFIFATHMHHLVNIPHIAQIEPYKLDICHLSVMYDEATDILVYNRKLQPGPGSSIYGLMVARALGLPLEFINKAHEVIQYINGANQELVPTNTSRYNNKVYIDACVMCGKTRAETELNTHHIQEQHMADARNLIGNMHKNVKDNLTILCRSCHTNLHREKKELEILDTSKGKIICLKPDSTSVESPIIQILSGLSLADVGSE